LIEDQLKALEKAQEEKQIIGEIQTHHPLFRPSKLKAVLARSFPLN